MDLQPKNISMKFNLKNQHVKINVLLNQVCKSWKNNWLLIQIYQKFHLKMLFWNIQKMVWKSSSNLNMWSPLFSMKTSPRTFQQQFGHTMATEDQHLVDLMFSILYKLQEIWRQRLKKESFKKGLWFNRLIPCINLTIREGLSWAIKFRLTTAFVQRLEEEFKQSQRFILRKILK